MAFVDKQTGISKRSGYFYEGKEIALTKDKRTTRVPNRKYPTNYITEPKKVEVATLYAVTKDFRQVAELSGISVNNLKKLSEESWWDNIVRQVTKEKNEELDVKITSVIDKAIFVLADRLENGNEYVDKKTKEKYRVPANIKDTANALDILFDKRQLIRGEATTTTKTITYNDRLKTIRDTFENLGKEKKIEKTEDEKTDSGNYAIVQSLQEEGQEAE
jgi:hypothetical protein